MKAMVLTATGPVTSAPLQPQELDDPQPGAGEAVIRVSACGVCRSNLHMIEGDWLPSTPAMLPIIPGHEVVGVVTSVGPDVPSLAVGDRVGVQPIWSTCGCCEFCLSGREQLCRRRQVTGETRHGGYAEQLLVDASYVYPIPPGLADAEAAPLLCPGVTAYGAVQKAQLAPGQRVGVLGVGGVGHMAVQMAALTGADVHAITRSAEHRLLAEELGAVCTHAPGDVDLPDGTLDAAIVFAPSDRVVGEAMRITKPGGRIVLGVAQNVGHLDIGDEKTVVGSVLGNRVDVRAVLALAAAGRVHSVVSEHPLSEANQVLASLKAGEVRARAVLVP